MFDPWVWKIPWRRKWQPTLVFLPGKSYGWRSLTGYSPWVCKELDMAKQLHFHLFTFMHWRRKWQPTPQCSCLENPRDGGARWAAIYGVAQSWTRLKQLSILVPVLFTWIYYAIFQIKTSPWNPRVKRITLEFKPRLHTFKEM